MAIPSAGQAHSELLQELFAEMKRYRTVDSKVTEEERARIFQKLDAILLAPDLEALVEAKRVAKLDIHNFVTGLWLRKKAKGLETPERLMKEAKSKESFAKWRKDLGGEDNKARAAKSLSEAAALRDRALELEAAKNRPPPPRPVVFRPVEVAPTKPTLRADGRPRRLLIIDVAEEPYDGE